MTADTCPPRNHEASRFTLNASPTAGARNEADKQRSALWERAVVVACGVVRAPSAEFPVGDPVPASGAQAVRPRPSSKR
jgi:hypothetical protein